LAESDNRAKICPPASRRQVGVICAALVLLTLVVFWQARDFSFVDLDDRAFVSSNPYVQHDVNWGSVHWALTSVTRGNWQPVVWLSYMLDYQVNGLDPEVFHLTNVALHVANTLLLFGILLSLTGLPWRSAFVAALFAIHPLHVESVAWVAERKDVLSTLFWFLTMWAYVRYVRRLDTARYVVVIAVFALGLMAKPMLVSLPIVLLLMDFWPLQRMTGKVQLRNLIIEKLPMLVLAAFSCGLTVWCQGAGGAVQGLIDYPVGVRFANAGVACVGYLSKMVWPRDLAVFYPHPSNTLPTWQVAGSYALLAAVTALALLWARRRPYLLVGWLWYLVSLIPVIGIVQVGAQAMADRYTYVPLIGIFIAVTWLVAEPVGAARRVGLVAAAARTGLAVVALVILGTLAVVAHSEVRHWQDTKTLFRHALRVNERNALAHLMLGSALANEGDRDAAMVHWHRAIEIDPNEYAARMNYATGLCVRGRLDEAITHYQEVVRLKPDFAEAHVNLGVILAEKGRFREATAHFKAALKVRPDYGLARDCLRRAQDISKE